MNDFPAGFDMFFRGRAGHRHATRATRNCSSPPARRQPKALPCRAYFFRDASSGSLAVWLSMLAIQSTLFEKLLDDRGDALDLRVGSIRKNRQAELSIRLRRFLSATGNRRRLVAEAA